MESPSAVIFTWIAWTFLARQCRCPRVEPTLGNDIRVCKGQPVPCTGVCGLHGHHHGLWWCETQLPCLNMPQPPPLAGGPHSVSSSSSWAAFTSWPLHGCAGSRSAPVVRMLLCDCAGFLSSVAVVMTVQGSSSTSSGSSPSQQRLQWVRATICLSGSRSAHRWLLLSHPAVLLHAPEARPTAFDARDRATRHRTLKCDAAPMAGTAAAGCARHHAAAQRLAHAGMAHTSHVVQTACLHASAHG